MATTPAVWVVDDDRSVRTALTRLLHSAALEVVTLHDPAELLLRLRQEQPECLILDVWLEGSTGLELLPRIEACAGWIPVIFLSAAADIRTCVEAMKSGAIDFLEKPAQEGPLLEAVIRAVARGRLWREARDATAAAWERIGTLTPREREVFSHVARGKPNKRIAAELGTTEKTIKVHRGRVMQKLGAESLVDLVRLAQQIGQLAA